MKYSVLIIAIIMLFIGSEAKAGNGGAIFESLHCGMCHRVDTGNTIPSLQQITQAYKGKEGRLVTFLQGGAEAIVNPKSAEMMKGYIEKTKALTEPERKALADFILSHGK